MLQDLSDTLLRQQKACVERLKELRQTVVTLEREQAERAALASEGVGMEPSPPSADQPKAAGGGRKAVLAASAKAGEKKAIGGSGGKGSNKKGVKKGMKDAVEEVPLSPLEAATMAIQMAESRQQLIQQDMVYVKGLEKEKFDIVSADPQEFPFQLLTTPFLFANDILAMRKQEMVAVKHQKEKAYTKDKGEVAPREVEYKLVVLRTGPKVDPRSDPAPFQSIALSSI